MIIILFIVITCSSLFFLTWVLGESREALFYMFVLTLLTFIIGLFNRGAVWFELAATLAACVLGFVIVNLFNSRLNLSVLLGFGLVLEIARHTIGISCLDYSIIFPASSRIQFSIIEIITLITLFAYGIRVCFGIPVLFISIGSLLLSSVLQVMMDLPISVLHILALIFLIENLISLKTVKQNG